MDDPRLETLVREQLADAGLRASIVVRDLDSSSEISLDGDLPTPAASLAKIPLALAVLEEIADGRIDGSSVRVVGGRGATGGGTGGPTGSTGTSRFRHPARIAVDDLVSLALTISDEDAADALLDLVGLAEVAGRLERIAIRGIAVRHGFGELSDTPLDRLPPSDAHLAHTLAIRGSTPANGHPIQQLDIARTNVGTAIAWADLLQAIWLERGVSHSAAIRMREHLGNNLLRQRLAPDFLSDDDSWASKTGTVLNLRHEAGVVEHADGSRFAVVALSTSMVPATHQPAAEAALGAAARQLHDALRATLPTRTVALDAPA